MYLSVEFSTLLSVIVAYAFAGELTFELPDNERMCFHEVVEKDIKCTIEFQVIIFHRG